MSSIQIQDAASNIFQLTPADFDYQCEIVMALKFNERPSGYGIWDDGSQYDFRKCRANWSLSTADAETFSAIFRDTNKSRAKSVNFILQSGSGFFPFGPDKGDEGTFQARLIGRNEIGTGNEPWKYFSTEVEFVAESFPPYAPPAQKSEGTLQIGTIQNLRFPPDFAKLKNEYSYQSSLTRDGSPYTVDLGVNSDKYSNSMQMVLNESNAAALINYLVGTARGSSFTIQAIENGFLFGRDKDSSDGTVYTCKLLSNVITVINLWYNRFVLSFDTFLESVA